MSDLPKYDESAFPFTVEDWTDLNAVEILACCRDVYMANAAWIARAKQSPNRRIVARWNRSWTTRDANKDKLELDWSPTAEHINALPDPIRRYIHDLQTNADPAGTLAENFRLRRENEMLRKECERLAKDEG